MLEILAQTGINMVETDHVLTEFHLWAVYVLRIMIWGF
jgi:hypothetical protein